MRNILTIAALAAGLATAAGAATPTMTHHHHSAKADDGAAEVRALNEKSLQEASAGMPMTAQMAQSVMSDSGAPAAMGSGSMNATPTTPQ